MDFNSTMENAPQRSTYNSDNDEKINEGEPVNYANNDVLCGRGKTSFNHVGNQRFRSIIAESIDDYNSVRSRKAKSAVVKRVHEAILATGGRFLRLDSTQGKWVELGKQRSLEKVSHAIRDATSTNVSMKKRRERADSTIAEVAAHVISRFPSVQLEHKMDGGDEERLAFKSIDIGNSASPPSLPTSMPLHAAGYALQEDTGTYTPIASMALREDPAPTREQQVQRLAQQPTQLFLPAPLQRSGRQSEHLPRSQQQEMQRPQRSQHMQQPQQQPQRQQNEDDFVSYINDVLGPVTSDDVRTDPLQRLVQQPRRPPSRKKG